MWTTGNLADFTRYPPPIHRVTAVPIIIAYQFSRYPWIEEWRSFTVIYNLSGQILSGDPHATPKSICVSFFEGFSSSQDVRDLETRPQRSTGSTLLTRVCTTYKDIIITRLPAIREANLVISQPDVSISLWCWQVNISAIRPWVKKNVLLGGWWTYQPTATHLQDAFRTKTSQVIQDYSRAYLSRWNFHIMV